jgi:hypothetical protein
MLLLAVKTADTAFVRELAEIKRRLEQPALIVAALVRLSRWLLKVERTYKDGR